ncbi:aminoglycoside phosphotransferase family protein [Streptomyces erythrochromogenes]|uniref:aminoglycoside phosphotransferase family protein n=1 Tax=Streptomyces erythrochromogenes TaxID=285574 RepID=UPI00225BE983|nr:aminoglycoside phosphotransferase family protein [Streptomyces erythrochromogenes]MCX5587905.1 aminoglycoside phosphotransferase family protein [Streptomyces erythrochromogenes]
MDFLELYEHAATQRSGLAGFYNRNVRVQTEEGPVLVRIRSSSSESMDLACWPEAELLAALDGHVPAAPRLLHAARNPDFQIHEYVAGRRVDELAPDGKPLPDAVLKAVEGFFGTLLRVPSTVLPPTPADWPPDGDTPGFAGLLLELVRHIRHRGDAAVRSLYEALGVPDDPCCVLASRAHRLSRRPFRLLHADIHRKNMIMAEGGRVAFLDWELALWGDPVYDLADHLHKMSCTPADRRTLTEAWERSAPDECRNGWRADLDFYLDYEAMKSAVVDTVRWGRRIAGTGDADERRRLSLELAGKLAAAQPHWSADAPTATEPGEIEAAVCRCLPRT